MTERPPFSLEFQKICPRVALLLCRDPREGAEQPTAEPRAGQERTLRGRLPTHPPCYFAGVESPLLACSWEKTSPATLRPRVGVKVLSNVLFFKGTTKI